MNLGSQITELAMAYGLAAIGMLVGLLLMRADRRAYWRWPVYSAMAMALGVISWNLLRKHVFPVEWTQGTSTAMFAGALTLYGVLGLAMGLLLGRLTRRRYDADASEGRAHENQV